MGCDARGGYAPSRLRSQDFVGLRRGVRRLVWCYVSCWFDVSGLGCEGKNGQDVLCAESVVFPWCGGHGVLHCVVSRVSCAHSFFRASAFWIGPCRSTRGHILSLAALCGYAPARVFSVPCFLSRTQSDCSGIRVTDGYRC